ncbi:MAG: type II CAAX endopeptidase family protein [Candidatus Neomarinimicrobiota bacterium]
MNQKINIRIAFGIVIFSLLIALIIGAALVSILMVLMPNAESANISLFSMLLSTVFIGIPVVIYLRFNRLSIRERLRINNISLGTLLSIIIISIGFIIIVDELDRIVYILFGQPEFLREIAEQLRITSINNGVLIILTTVVVAPFVEEMLFRGYLQKVLEESWGDITKAILVTSMFFALVHLNPYWIIQIYLLGMVLGYLAWRTNSIIPGIILHGLNNGFAVALNNVEDVFSRHYNWSGHVNPLWIFIAIVLVILGFKMLNKDLESRS